VEVFGTDVGGLQDALINVLVNSLIHPIPAMTTQQFKIILAQNPQIQLWILLAFIEDAELESLELSKKSLSQEFKNIVKTHKFTCVAGQLTEFGIVNLISWLDPVSGFWIGIVCLVWHIFQDIREEEQDSDSHSK
jgi:hypothetical protein